MLTKVAKNPKYQGDPSYLVEMHFRQLRFENIQPIIDACYHGLQTVVSSTMNVTSGVKLETPSGGEYSLFHGVELGNIWFDTTSGASFYIKFQCPVHLRNGKLRKSTTLEPGKLCALLVVLDQDHKVDVVLCQIKERSVAVSYILCLVISYS